MSKRFGRNQKRALVAQLQTEKEISQALHSKFNQSDYARKMDQQLNKELGQIISEQKYIIEDVKRMFGEYFIAFNAQCVDDNLKVLPEYYYVQDREIMNFSSMAMRNTCANEIVRRTIKHLQVSKGTIHVDAIRQDIHFYLKTSNGDLGYCVDPQTWRKIPRRNLIQMICEMFANELQKIK
jgi:hypothetical protein